MGLSYCYLSVRPVRLERTTYGLEVRCSIPLSYGRKYIKNKNFFNDSQDFF